MDQLKPQDRQYLLRVQSNAGRRYNPYEERKENRKKQFYFYTLKGLFSIIYLLAMLVLIKQLINKDLYSLLMLLLINIVQEKCIIK